MLQIPLGEHYSFKCNLHIAIIYFDEIIGPKILNIYPEVSEERTQKVNMVLRHLLDIGSLKAQSERQFMYSDRDFSSLNLYFSIPSSVARGGYFDFMVSLIVTPTYPELISEWRWIGIHFMNFRLSVNRFLSSKSLKK